jgi:hypothetical protein
MFFKLRTSVRDGHCYCSLRAARTYVRHYCRDKGLCQVTDCRTVRLIWLWYRPIDRLWCQTFFGWMSLPTDGVAACTLWMDVYADWVAGCALSVDDCRLSGCLCTANGWLPIEWLSVHCEWMTADWVAVCALWMDDCRLGGCLCTVNRWLCRLSGCLCQSTEHLAVNKCLKGWPWKRLSCRLCTLSERMSMPTDWVFGKWLLVRLNIVWMDSYAKRLGGWLCCWIGWQCQPIESLAAP